MISLFSINKFANIKCDDIPKNQWYNVDKSNKNDEIVSQFLELERTIAFRQGLNNKCEISFLLSDLDSHFSKKTYTNNEGNKMDSKYVLLIPIQISTPDKYMFNTTINGTNNCLIIQSQENYCIGFNDSEISNRVIENDKNNCYLFVHFTSKPFFNSLTMDTIKECFVVNEKISTQLVKKSNIDFSKIEEQITDFTNYVSKYELKKPYTFLFFKNPTKDSNTFYFDDNDQLINNYIFQDERTNNYLRNDNDLTVFKTNILMYEDDFEKAVMNVNKVDPNSIDSYILNLVEKFFELNSLKYENNYCITITISNVKPQDSIIMIPLSKTNESPLYFCKQEETHNTINDKTSKNVNSVHVLNQSNQHIYFLNKFFCIIKENIDDKYCFVTLHEPSHSDSDLYMSKKVNKEINGVILEKVPVKYCISDIHSISTSSKYNEFVDTINQKFKDTYNENISISNDNVILLSKSWFDEIHVNENEKMFDIVNYSNVINTGVFNYDNTDNNVDTYKSIYMNVAPHITTYFNFEKINVIKTIIYELTDVTQFVPPEDCLYMYVFLQHSSKISIECNNCTFFTPCCSPGSILIHTFKKTIIMKTDSACKILIFTIKII